MPDGEFSLLEGFERGETRRLVERKLTNVPMEQALLGALLLKSALLDIIPPALVPDSFSDLMHGEIYGAIAAIGHGANPISVEKALRPGDTDLRTYLGNLIVGSTGTNRALIKQYADGLIDLDRKRRLFAVTQALREQILAEGPQPEAEVLIGKMMADFEQLSVSAPTSRPASTMIEAVDAAIAAGERFAKGERDALSTGFASMDTALGGMEAGGVYILAARPGMGKTALGLQIAIEAARSGAGVCVISLEMQALQLGRRALAMESGVAQSALKEGRWDRSQDDYIFKARQRLADLPLTIEDQGGLNTQMIALKARAAQRKHGLKLLVIDHLHIVATPQETTRMGATWAVGQVSNALKRLAKDMQIPVLALAQLNRGVEGRDDKRPTMSDLRQSGDIEQDAEAIMLLYRPEYYLGKSPPEQGERQTASQHEQAVSAWHDAKERLAGKAEVIFEKVRDGEPCTVSMIFDGARTCFREAGR